MNEKEVCIICAWRVTCQKQFAMKAGQKCPDYCKDLTLREPESIREESGGPETE